MTVAEIGEAVGFSGAAHFRKLFRAQYGLSPSAYRARGERDGRDAAAASDDKTDTTGTDTTGG